MKNNSSYKYKFAAPLGMVFVIMAIVGIITVAVFGMKYTSKIIGNDSAKQELEDIIRPVLMFDPVPFDKITDVSNLTLLESAIWATLMNAQEDAYANDEMLYKIIPTTDIDLTAAKMYGSEIKLEHQSFYNFDMVYQYDEELKAYHVPVQINLSLYSPKVLNINKKGDIYEIEVGYIPPGNVWSYDAKGKEKQLKPDKIMMYEMKKVKNNYQLIAIKETAYNPLAQIIISQPTQK